MKVVTTNLLNRFWKNGIKPIKDALTGKVDSSRIINSLLTTEEGFALDARQGKVLNDKITELNGNLMDYIIVRQLSSSYTADANGTGDINIALEVVDGYKPLAVIPRATGNSSAFFATCTFINNNTTVNARMKNTKSASVTANASVNVLYIRERQTA